MLLVTGVQALNRCLWLPRYPHISKRLQVHLAEDDAAILVRRFKRTEEAVAPSTEDTPSPAQDAHGHHHDDNERADAVTGTAVVTIRHVEGDAVLVVEQGSGGKAEVSFMPLTGAQKDPGSKAFFWLER